MVTTQPRWLLPNPDGYYPTHRGDCVAYVLERVYHRDEVTRCNIVQLFSC